MKIEDRLAELGLMLPQAAKPVASYVPVVVHNGLAYVSGQLPFINDQLATGRLGEDIGLERGIEAAKACGLMILSQVEDAGIDLNRVEKVIKLGGFVNSTPGFTDQPKVVNGASDLMFDLFGEKGVHARAAVGVPSLPLGACVEVDAIIAFKE